MDEMTETAAYDGNILAGPLSEVFTIEATTAVARCAECGRTSAIGTLRVYSPEPGMVGRCPGCDAVLVRLVRTTHDVWLDLSGVAALRVPVPDVRED
jgi:Zn finger protein HypA/HybF involved in hydrogenase expression